jgi:hypothetical protein
LYDQLADRAELHNLAASDDPGIQAVKRALRQSLIAWCADNGLPEMLDNGDLHREERIPDYSKPDRGNTFGRRWY